MSSHYHLPMRHDVSEQLYNGIRWKDNPEARRIRTYGMVEAKATHNMREY